MAMRLIELITGSLEDKKAYRRYRARIDVLPEPYRTAARSFERYFMHNGGITDGDPRVMMTMLTDFADLWERAAADGTGVAEIVGEDPVEFADAFAAAYTGKRWMDRERARLTESIRRIAEEER
ncbi:DUF1048 domain-containing protein [Microbacterium chocolatum]|uniref:DUF1048 domain-containing protein n=1 Tax=Microbacterium aurantiacum TaxID=162393 RepID=UPI00338D5575